MINPIPITAAAILLGATFIASTALANPPYPWPRQTQAPLNLATAIAAPSGFARVAAKPGSFAHWLRGLPMKPPGSPVRLHTGAPKWIQTIHAAVIDIDTGKRDLQQCADAVMRLRAEYLRASGRASSVAFNETGAAKPMSYALWAKGHRPRVSGNRLHWSRRAKSDDSYQNFRKYLTIVFAYAGTYSLAKELRKVPRSDIRIGDVFIKGGFPGHALLVTDMVQHKTTGEKRFLLIQSFMPAQDMHILMNPNSKVKSPWYAADFDGPLITPEWTFPPGSLMRWR